MEKEDIRIGGKYLLPVTVTTIEKSGFLEVETIHDYSYRLAPSEVKTILSREASAFPHINPYPPLNLPIMTEIPETYPKYDPRRKFRKGDKVRVVEWNGRNPVLPFMDCKVGDIGTVIKAEDATSFFVRLQLERGYEKDMPYCHLELVTPVEELEPYSLHESKFADSFNIVREKMCVMMFPFGSKETGYYRNRLAAKEAAEAECARMNAEYRKEMEK